MLVCSKNAKNSMKKLAQNAVFVLLIYVNFLGKRVYADHFDLLMKMRKTLCIPRLLRVKKWTVLTIGKWVCLDQHNDDRIEYDCRQ